MRRLLVVTLALFLPVLCWSQWVTPTVAQGGPFTVVDGCVPAGYGFDSNPNAGICRDDGTGPYGVVGVALQSSDPTDFEYAGFLASEGDPDQFQIVSFNDAGADGVLIAGRAHGTVLGTNLSLDASDFLGGQAGSVNINMDAPDAGPYTHTVTVSDSTAGTTCAVTQTPLGLGLCPYAFAALPAAVNGTLVYCSDCSNTAPCAGAGGGNVAKREGGAWNCD